MTAKNCADGVKALDRELIPAGFGKLVFPQSVRIEPTVAAAPPEILPVEESVTVLDHLMDDLALFEHLDAPFPPFLRDRGQGGDLAEHKFCYLH